MAFFDTLREQAGRFFKAPKKEGRGGIDIPRPDVTPEEYEKEVLGTQPQGLDDLKKAAEERQFDAALAADYSGDHARADAIRKEMKADVINQEPIPMESADEEISDDDDITEEMEQHKVA